MATKYNDIVTLRSMRPAYNIKNEGPDDWKTFIANDQFNDLLKKTISAVRNNDADSHKAVWVAGTYGSGKSHAGAVLKHLLCDKVEDIEDYVNEEYAEDKYALLRNSIFKLRENKRLFPINLYGQQSIAHEADLSLQVQKEVIRALKAAGIQLTVQTDFDNYIQHIESEPDLWNMLIDNNEVLKSVAPDLKILKTRLANGDTEVLNRVTLALRNMGINVPIKNSNLKTWIFEVQNELRTQGVYDGLLIIWDEFTDVMRSELGVPLLKLLQEIAEDMMNPENDSYFLFLSHPSALNSLKEAEREQTRGRYHYVIYNMEPVSAFRIMSKKFVVVDKTLYEQRQEFFCSLHEQLLTAFAASSTDPVQTKKDLGNLFPVHPSTANLATYFAREAGSSSRSVFEFLACDGVKAFFESENAYADKDTVTPNYLWDYVQEYFESDTARFGAVTERFNSHHLAVEAQGEDYLAVFKGILLLNALNNIANNDSVTPSEENIYNLFEGTPVYNNIAEILDYFNEKSIIQRQPDGNFSILFTALPTDEIQKIKEELKLTSFLYTEQVINYGDTAKNFMTRNLSQVARPLEFLFFSLTSNEYTLLNKIEVFAKNASTYSVLLAFMAGKTKQEIFELKDIIDKNKQDERFKNVCFVLLESPMGEKEYERFIEYQANATCAQKHGLANQQKTYAKNSSDMITAWLGEIRGGNVTFCLRDDELTISGTRMASTINNSIAPAIFTAGPESLEIIQTRSSNTFWKKASVKATVDAVLSFPTKDEIIAKCGGPAKHVEYLLQDSVDENLEWKSDISPDHPLKKVSDFIQSVFSHTNKNQSFNLGDKLLGLTLPPFGLFQSYAPMAMVAFAMRKYDGKIFDLNGKPRKAKHLVDDIVEMFKAWENGRTSAKLNFMFESKEAGAITKNLIKTFKLNKLPKYSDISSLTDARWAMTHEYSAGVGYPLWSLKYVPDCSEENKQLIDGIIKVISDSESVKNPALMTMVAEGLKNNIDLGNLLLESANNFEKGFKNYVMSLDYIDLMEDEFAEAKTFLDGHLEGTVGLWSERGVEDTLKNWRLAQQQERLREENKNRFHEEQEKYKNEDSDAANPSSTSTTPSWMSSDDGTDGKSTPNVAAEPKAETFEMKAKRSEVARKVMPLASNQQLRNLLQDLCDNGDMQTLDIIMKYV